MDIAAATIAPLVHKNRCVYEATLEPPAAEESFEYYIEIAGDDGGTLRYPATAPRLNQTVVIDPREN